MGTIITSDEPTGNPSEEATLRQVDHIFRLLEGRRLSERCAAKIIGLLLNEPILNGTGLEDLKVIQRPE